MSELSKVVKELSETAQAGGHKAVRFSVTVSAKDNARVEALTKRLKVTKQELVSKLLLAALSDLEKEL